MNHPEHPSAGRQLASGLSQSFTRVLAIAGMAALAAIVAGAADTKTYDHPVGSEGSVQERGKKAYYPADHFDLTDLPHYAPKERVSGTIRVWGSNYIKEGRTVEFWEAGFKKYHPDVTFQYRLPNSVLEVVSVATGVAEIGVGPRLTYNDSKSFSSLHGYEPTEIMFATGAFNVPGWNPAFAIFVNTANPISKLTIDQLDGIFGAARSGGYEGTNWRLDYARGSEMNIRTWGQAGATGEFADKPIHPLGLNLRAHWATSISDFLLKGSDQWNEDLRMYPGNYYFKDGTKISGAETMVVDVAKDPYAICYSCLFFKRPQTKALARAPRGGGTYYEMTLDNIRNRVYPLTDAIYMYANRAPGKPADPKVREFLCYILSQEGQKDIARDGKYLPLRAQDAEVNRRKIE
ncbi:MAG: hypothetical protein PHQ04_11855 [Opitutaceae bacterium]|nr:hypothetical protein [Opitutaceae bacterium]